MAAGTAVRARNENHGNHERHPPGPREATANGLRSAEASDPVRAAERWVKSARGSRGVRRVRRARARARARAMPSAVRELQMHEHVCSPDAVAS